MARRIACVVLIACSVVPSRVTAGGYTPPSPGVLQEIQARHGRKDWWYVTTDSTRFLVRIHEVDSQGLTGLKPKRKSDAVPDHIAWPSIARIDERHSKFLAKRIQGVLYGALIGGTVPFLIDQTNGGQHAAAGLIAGAVLGGWLGGMYGDGIEREEQVYISPTLITPIRTPTPAAPATTGDAAVVARVLAVDSTAVAHGALDAPPAPAGQAPAPNVTPPSATGTHRVPDPDAFAIEEACRQIRAADQVRIHADFGTFEGHVEHAGADGLGGLRSHSSHGPMESLPGIVTWDRIRQVDKKGNAAGLGARRGALILGGVGMMCGLFANAVAAGAGGEAGGGSWIMIGAAAGVAGGALIGAGIGASATSWTPLYVH